MVQNPGKHLLGDSLPQRILVLIEIGLDELEIPIAEFVPDKLVKAMAGFVEPIDLEGLSNLENGSIEPSPNPSVG